MLLPTPESPQHLTTPSSLEMDANLRSMKRLQQQRRLLLERETGKQYGHWTVLNTPIPLCKYPKVWVRCQCKREYLVQVSDLRGGKSKCCRSCRTRKYTDIPELPAKQLQERYNALAERVKAKKFTSRTYTQVENRFSSCEAFVRYMWETFPMQDYRGLEIDRIDNTGHYEPGNIQLSTREENAQRRKTNVMVQFQGKEMCVSKFCRDYIRSYQKDAVTKWIYQGVTPEEIIRRDAARIQLRLSYGGKLYNVAEFCRSFCGKKFAVPTMMTHMGRAIRNEEILLSALLKYSILSMPEAETVSVITV